MATGWRGGRRWLVSGAVAVAVCLGIIGPFQLSIEEGATTGRPAGAGAPLPGVTLVHEAERWVSEEAAMRDPTPLFLPTRFNATEEAFVAGTRRELSSAFRGFAPKLKYAENDLTLRWPAVVEVPQRVGDAFAKGDSVRPLAGFGQTGEGVAPLSLRTAFIEVVSAGDGELVFARALSGARPPAEGPWQPLQFLIAVDRAGVVGSPVLTHSSTVAAVDMYFQEYLGEVLHVGERLGPGFYRVGIGP